MAKRYIELKRPVKEYTAAELRERLGGLKKSELIRTIILNEKQFLAVDYNRSLRGFWYATVKPTLSKLGLLTKQDQEEKRLERWDADLSRYCAELVKLGVLSYGDIRIIDDSRRRENPQNQYYSVNEKTYGFIGSVAPFSNIVITTEKDTIYSIIENVARLFGCSCISGHGQNALSAMEDLIRGMNKPDDIYILTMTDYDPAGYYIADTFKNQANYVKKNFNHNTRIHINRIGITPDQLTEIEIEQNKYMPKPANRAKWFKMTGGINGEPYGLELDALPPDRIRQIFASSLKKYITDQTPYKSFIKSEYIKYIILSGIQDKIKDMTTEILAAGEERNITLQDFDIFDLCERGFNYIPVTDLCSKNRDNVIIDKAKSYFK